MASEGLNKVILIGNLGAEPELKYTQGGQAVMRLRLATTEKWADKGEKKERTEWHTVTLWGNRAEALSKFLDKGRTIYVEGRLQTRQWEDKDGGKRSTTEVVASNILLLGGGQRDSGERTSGSSGYGGRGGSAGQHAGYGDPPDGGFGDDNLPF